MVLQIWCVVLVFWVSGFRNCVTSKDFVFKQTKKTKQYMYAVHVMWILFSTVMLNTHHLRQNAVAYYVKTEPEQKCLCLLINFFFIDFKTFSLNHNRSKRFCYCTDGICALILTHPCTHTPRSVASHIAAVPKEHLGLLLLDWSINSYQLLCCFVRCMWHRCFSLLMYKDIRKPF